MTAERQIPMVLVAVSLAVVLLVPAVSVAAQAGPAVLSDVTVTPQPDAINIFVLTSRGRKHPPGRTGRPRRRRAAPKRRGTRRRKPRSPRAPAPARRAA